MVMLQEINKSRNNAEWPVLHSIHSFLPIPSHSIFFQKVHEFNYFNYFCDVLQSVVNMDFKHC